MERAVKPLLHKDKTIILCDLSNLEEKEQIRMLGQLEEFYAKGEPNSLLVLTDITNTVTTSRVKARIIDLLSKYGKAKKAQAMIGMTGFQRMIAKALIPDICFAETVDEAKDWLAEQ